ncbi:MAG: hypothetical protein K2Q26_04840 [Bdellovibrionales bacterium]|nr:hypothetical protein [Bdellovibrionales bacterium]
MRKLISLLFIIPFLTLSLSSCTTSEDETEDNAIEAELNSELEDMEGSGTNADLDVESDDGLEDFDDTNFEDDGKEFASDSTTDSSTDDDFFSDADTPPSGPGNNPPVLAENDLKQELQQGAVPPPASADTAGTAVQAPYPEDIPPAVPLPKDNGANGPVTSRSTFPRIEDYESINPTPDVPKDDLGVADPLVSQVDAPLPSMRAAKEVVPISKIGKDPFFRNERIMNTVYIARPGDDMGTISQKIFNEDRTAQLLADNPHISKGIEPGDKVYYNSINRPEDKKTIMTYFEDSRYAPQYYTTKNDDDIRKIGQQLLGYADAWKEIWAVNDSLQTQAMLPAGLKIKYWTGNEVRETPPPKATPVTTEPEVVAETEPKQEAEIPLNITNIETPLPTTSGTTVNTDDPALSAGITEPLPMAPDASVPPTPNTPQVKDGSSTTTIAALALIAMAVIILVAIQIKNRRKDPGAMPPSLEFTKV